jgi:hypothetical protein
MAGRPAEPTSARVHHRERLADALAAQRVVVLRVVPAAAFDQHHLDAGGGQLQGNCLAGRTGSTTTTVERRVVP